MSLHAGLLHHAPDHKLVLQMGVQGFQVADLNLAIAFPRFSCLLAECLAPGPQVGALEHICLTNSGVNGVGVCFLVCTLIF